MEKGSDPKERPTKSELEEFRFRLAEDQIAEHGSTKATGVTLSEFIRHCDKQGWSEDWQGHFTNWVAREKRLGVTSPTARSATSSSLSWTSDETPVTVCVQWPSSDRFAEDAEKYRKDCPDINQMVCDKIDGFKRQNREPIVDVPGFVRKVAQLEFDYEGNE
ncbi:MAG: hypothetical protein P8L85_07960 [Rubripirellula sp.]|nr:hypothetical protein [Rubripirellula sp.]